MMVSCVQGLYCDRAGIVSRLIYFSGTVNSGLVYRLPTRHEESSNNNCYLDKNQFLHIILPLIYFQLLVAVFFFPIFSIIIYKAGTISTPRMVATSIPLKTVIPITFLPSAPAPEAVSKGVTPRIKANAVIRIGLKRSFAADIAASKRGTPFSCSALANSTIRIAFLATSPMSNTSPICAKTLLR